MRYSSDKNDAGFANFQGALRHGKVVHAFMNGKEIKDVVTVDDTEGFVLHYKRGDDGHLVDDGNSLISEQLHGAVTIVLEDRNGP